MTEIKEGDIVVLKTLTAPKMVVGVVYEDELSTKAHTYLIKMAKCYYFFASAPEIKVAEIALDALVKSS